MLEILKFITIPSAMLAQIQYSWIEQIKTKSKYFKSSVPNNSSKLNAVGPLCSKNFQKKSQTSRIDCFYCCVQCCSVYSNLSPQWCLCRYVISTPMVLCFQAFLSLNQWKVCENKFSINYWQFWMREETRTFTFNMLRFLFFFKLLWVRI